MATKKIKSFISFVLVLAFLTAGTLFIYFYSKGYRIDITDGEIDKTGVITVETLPRRADIYIDGKGYGKSPKAIPGLPEGNHKVLLQKEGYQDWSMDVTVKPEQSIPIMASLLYSNPEIENITIENLDTYQIDKFFTDENNQIAIFTIASTDNTVLQVYGYPINRRFWELEANPYLIMELNTSGLEQQINMEDYQILISPNSQRGLITTTINSVKKYYTFYADRLNAEPVEIEDFSYNGTVAPTWSKDSQYLVFSKNNELRTLNIDSLVQTVIKEKLESENFVWTSTETSQIYYIKSVENDYNIERILATGDNKSTVIENVIKTSKLSYTDSQTPSINSVLDIHVSEDGDFLIILEEKRILVYSFKEDTFAICPAESPTFLGFSPESEKFIYTSGKQATLFEYNLAVSEGDPIHTLGQRTLLIISPNYEPVFYTWDPETMAVLFSNKNNDNGTYTIRSVSIDGLNENIIYSLTYSEKFAVGNSGKYIISTCEGPVLCKITVRE